MVWKCHVAWTISTVIIKSKEITYSKVDCLNMNKLNNCVRRKGFNKILQTIRLERLAVLEYVTIKFTLQRFYESAMGGLDLLIYKIPNQNYTIALFATSIRVLCETREHHSWPTTMRICNSWYAQNFFKNPCRPPLFNSDFQLVLCKSTILKHFVRV